MCYGILGLPWLITGSAEPAKLKITLGTNQAAGRAYAILTGLALRKPPSLSAERLADAVLSCARNIIYVKLHIRRLGLIAY